MATTAEDRAAEPLTLTMTARDIVIVMSEGNPGAINVMMALLLSEKDKGVMDLLHLDDMNMRGSQIWVAFKDFAGQDMERFVQAVRDRDPDMVLKVNQECAGCGHVAVTHGGSRRSVLNHNPAHDEEIEAYEDLLDQD